ncbi:MAG: hypothetical protein WBW44_01970, partial [Solirubrobacterales bacterium]
MAVASNAISSLKRGKARRFVGLAALALTLLFAAEARPATIVVDSADDPDPSVVDGNCTLREAIDSVDDTGADACASGIDVAVDVITFTGLGPGNHQIDAYRDFIL